MAIRPTVKPINSAVGEDIRIRITLSPLHTSWLTPARSTRLPTMVLESWFSPPLRDTRLNPKHISHRHSKCAYIPRTLRQEFSREPRNAAFLTFLRYTEPPSIILSQFPISRVEPQSMGHEPFSIFSESSHPLGPVLRLNAAGLGPGTRDVERGPPPECPEFLESHPAD
jgi:hypothetical protein